MKKIIAAITAIVLLASCSHKKDIPELLEGKFSAHYVTFEYSKPVLNIENNNYKNILVLLHHRVPKEKIKKYFSMSDSLWNDKINYLFGKGLIKKNDEGNYLPSCFVLDSDNEICLKKITDSLGVEMSQIAQDRLEKIKIACANIPSLKNQSFNDISLFVLGSVTHDFWQEKFYQDQFLKSFIPQHGDANYYFALFNNKNGEGTTKNIYETRFHNFAKIKLGSFSNKEDDYDFQFLLNDELKMLYKSNEADPDSVYQNKILLDLIKLITNSHYKIDSKIVDVFNRLGFISDGRVNIPYITRNDIQKLYNVAAIITPDLINYFENRQTLFVKLYLNSQYREETNYREWMLWIYKMVTSRAIEELMNKSIIKTSKDKSALFILEK